MLTREFFIVYFLILKGLVSSDAPFRSVPQENNGRYRRQAVDAPLSGKVITFNENGQFIDQDGVGNAGNDAVKVDFPFPLTTYVPLQGYLDQSTVDTQNPLIIEQDIPPHNPFPLILTTLYPPNTEVQVTLTNLNDATTKPINNPPEIQNNDIQMSTTDNRIGVNNQPKTEQNQASPLKQQTNIEISSAMNNNITKNEIQPTIKNGTQNSNSKQPKDTILNKSASAINTNILPNKNQNMEKMSERNRLIMTINDLYAKLARLTGTGFRGRHHQRLVGNRQGNPKIALGQVEPNVGRVEFLHPDDRIEGREGWDRLNTWDRRPQWTEQNLPVRQTQDRGTEAGDQRFWNDNGWW